MSFKTMSIRIEKDDYDFVKGLAKEEKEDVSKAMRELIDKGRIHLAIEQYKQGKVSLGRASQIAAVPIGEMIDILMEYGVSSNLEEEDYLAGLKNLEAVY